MCRDVYLHSTSSAESRYVADDGHTCVVVVGVVSVFRQTALVEKREGGRGEVGVEKERVREPEGEKGGY